MERYRFPAEERSVLEKLVIPYAVFQYIDGRVVTLLVSDGFLRLAGYADRETAEREMSIDIYKGIHPDDVPRIADAALRFATDTGRYEVVYRRRPVGKDEYRIIHASGRRVEIGNGVHLGHICYVDEGPCLEGDTSRGAELNAALINTLL